MSPPDLSIIIVSWNTRELLRNCLASVFAEPTGMQLEVFVVDNASADGSAEMIRTEFPQVQLIENQTNVGFGAANNQLLPKCTAGQILLLNPDTVVCGNALRTLSEFLRTHRDVGAVGPKLTYPHLPLRVMDCGFQPTLWRVFNHQFGLAQLFPQTPLFRGIFMFLRHHADRPRQVEWVSGACLLVRREVVNAIGPLKLDMYAEDWEWCNRIIRAGWKISSVPEAEVQHVLGASARQRDEANVMPVAALRRYFLFLNQPGILKRSFFDFVMLAGMGLRAIAFLAASVVDRRRCAIWRKRAKEFAGLVPRYARLAFSSSAAN